MTPPAPFSSSPNVQVIQGAYAGSAHLKWRLPISYSAIAGTVCALDVAIIIATSIVTGTSYSLFVRDSDADLVRYTMTAIVTSVMFVPRFRNRGLYDPSALVNWGLQARNIIVFWIATFLAFAAVAFALKIATDFSRGAVLSFGIAGLVALLAHHALWRIVIEGALQNGSLRGRKSILLSLHEPPGDTRLVRDLAHDLVGHGFNIEHFFHVGPGRASKEVVEQVIATARGSNIEEIFFAADVQRWKEISHLVERLCVLPIPLTLLPDECTATLFGRPSRQFGMTVGVEFQRAPLTAIECFLKRLLDAVCSISGIVLLMPMFVIVALAIKLDSPGPVLFKQTRHGFNSKRFKIFKFRTMNVLEDGPSIVQAARDDKRLTRIGMWLRKTSIDELPQLYNVLVGDMSIVGPRPHATAHDNYYADLIGNYAFRHHVKPGITGWAQVRGFRGETPTTQSMKERVDHDIWYIDNWSVLLDIQIILRTAFEVIRGRNAY